MSLEAANPTGDFVATMWAGGDNPRQPVLTIRGFLRGPPAAAAHESDAAGSLEQYADALAGVADPRRLTEAELVAAGIAKTFHRKRILRWATQLAPSAAPMPATDNTPRHEAGLLHSRHHASAPAGGGATDLASPAPAPALVPAPARILDLFPAPAPLQAGPPFASSSVASSASSWRRGLVLRLRQPAARPPARPAAPPAPCGPFAPPPPAPSRRPWS